MNNKYKTLIGCIADGIEDYNDNKHLCRAPMEYVIRKHVVTYLNDRFLECAEKSEHIDEECLMKLWNDIMIG